MPAQKYARPERDRMKFIAPIILHANNAVFQLSLRDNIIDSGFSFYPYLKIWAMRIPSLRDGF